MNIDASIRAKYYGGVTHDRQFIVLHYTANSGTKATAKGVANFFANNPNQSSAHYVVDEGDTAYLCVPEDHAAWAVGGNKYPQTSGASFYGECGNFNSISIEMVSHTTEDDVYYIPKKTVDNALELTKMLQKKYGIDDDHVIRHYDVNGKPCPWCWTNVAPYQGDALWQDFKRRLGYTVSDILYRVQVGAFKNKANAENYMQGIRAKGFPAFVTQVGDLWKVQVGAFKNKNNALNYIAELKAAGYDCFIVEVTA